MNFQQVSEHGAKISVEGLLFELGNQRFALPIADVNEVVRAVEIRRLPGAPAITLGIIDVRGEIMPVLDVRARFGFCTKTLDPADQFILCQAGPRKVALHVDRTICMMQLSMVRAGRESNLAQAVERFAGVASTTEGLVLIHDLRAFLSQAEAETLDSALATERRFEEPPLR